MSARGIRARIRRLFRLPPIRLEDLDEEIDDEIRLHIDLRTRQLVSLGIAAGAARAEALRRFGPLDEARYRLRDSARRRERQMRIREMVDAFSNDLRLALRALRRQPAFTAAVTLTLALGIGANATMFAIVDRLLFRPPAYLAEPGETGRVFLYRTIDGEERIDNNISYLRYRDITEVATAFSQTAAFFNTEMVVGLGDQARQHDVSLVSASFWPFFGARPALGRFFGEGEDALPQGSAVAVLGHAYWRSALAGDSTVLGRPIHIGRNAYTIIGIAPPDFTGMSLSPITAFIPITAGGADLFPPVARRDPWYATHNLTWMEMLVRRKPGLTVEAANADLSRAFQASVVKARERNPTPGAPPLDQLDLRGSANSIIFDRGPEPRQSARVATWVAGVSVLVLLLACANVASLLLARAMQRRREIAVRVALGVSRGRLVRYLLTESIILAAIGGVLALVVANWGGRGIRSLLLTNVAWTGPMVDQRVLLFTALAALVAGALTGLAPAIQLTRPDVAGALKSGGREGGVSRTRLRGSLIALQGAITVILLIGAGLFVRSLQNVRTLDLGYDPDRLINVDIELRGTVLDSARRVALLSALEAHAMTLPGVENASITVGVPFWRGWSDVVRAPGVDTSRLGNDFYLNAVSPSYFSTTGTGILRGRGLEMTDRHGAELVAVISDQAAKSIWPGEEALGRCIKIGADTSPCITIVGIAEDIYRSFDEGPAAPHVYLPFDQNVFQSAGLFVRTRGPARLQLDATRRALQTIMPGAAYVDTRSLQSLVEPSMRPWELGATMFTLFGMLALVVAALGLYSVITYSVTQRLHEIGVRVALGAQTRDIVRLVVGEGVRIIAIGAAIGVGVAFLATRFLASLLFEVSERDPATFGFVVVALLLVAAGASMIPALRASRVDPNVALRAE
jgi:predicted permease